MVQSSLDMVSPSPRLAVEHAGTGPMVIFMHGIGGNRSFWRPQIAEFSKHFHAAAWDARGYGSSEDYEGPIAISGFSADLVRVLDYFKVQKAHLVGLSMGGMVAMDFTIRYPDRVATLTVCDSSNGLGDVPPERREEFIRSRQEPLLNGKEPKDIAPDVARLLWGKSAPQSAFDRLVEGMEAIHKESFLKAIEATAHVAPLELERISVPTHVVVGDEDLLTPPKTNEALAARIPGSLFSIISRAGHISNVDNPDGFNETVLPFILKHRDAAH